jgi:hypothetical protein
MLIWQHFLFLPVFYQGFARKAIYCSIFSHADKTDKRTGKKKKATWAKRRRQK